MYGGYRLTTLVRSSGFQPLRSRMTTKVIKRFVRVICVILCLIISTTAYAESILWSTKHSSTSFEKDQEWISEQLLSEQSVTAMEAIEDIDGDIEDPEDSEEFIEIIDATLVVEGTEATPLVITEATPLEITMDSTTSDEIQEDSVEYAAPEESMDEGVEEINAPIDKTGDNQSS